MCDICRQTPCDFRCPNFDEDDYFHKHCVVCNNAIFFNNSGLCDEEYYFIDNDYICYDDACLKEYCDKKFKRW